MLKADDLLNAVDSFTGQVSFTLPLVNLPGRNGLDLSLSASYSGPVWKSACTWNLDAPTGVLGLGWGLPLARIFAVFDKSAAPEAAAYFLAWRGGVRRLWCTGQSGNNWTYGTSGNDAWQITYNPSSQIWAIIDEDGVTHIFGDTGSGRNTVQNMVCWGNWLGSSDNLPQQQTIASGWLLNQSQNRFGDAIVYTYGTISVAVSGTQGKLFTQSVVLMNVVAADGSQVQFNYGTKQAAEMQNPHTNPAPPNAYQDPLNPRFLQSISVQSGSATPLYTLQFSYPQTLLGPTNFGKRLLSGVQYVTPEGLTRPPLQFSYFGQSQQDGVNPAQPFNSATGALYGGLKAVTLIEGGVVSFSYAQTNPLQYAARSLTITTQAPSPTQPLFYFEDDYLVATWLGSDNNCWVAAYTWNGRWIPQQLATIPVGGAAGYAAVQVATSPSCFSVWGGGRLYLFRPDPLNLGAWIVPNAGNSQPYYTPTFDTSETTILAMGDGFAGILGVTSGNLYRYRWLGMAWTSDSAVQITGSVLTLAARDSMLIAVSAPTATTSANLWLYRRDMAGNWESNQSVVNLGTVLPTSISLVMGATFAAYMGGRVVGANRQLQYAAIWWSADLSSVSSTVLPATMVPSSATPTLPLVAGDLVAIASVVYRFDGTQWNQFNLASITYPNQSGAVVSVGADVAVRQISLTTPGQAIYEISAYNPNTGQWQQTNAQGSTLLGIAAPRTRDFVSNYAVSAGALQYLQWDGTWIPGQALSPAQTLAADLPTVQVLGSDYVIYQVGTGTGAVQTCVYLLENGATTNAQAISLAGQQVAVPGDTRNMLVGRRGFVTYTGTYGSASSVLTLHRPVNLDAVSPQTAYVAASVTADNGYNGIAGYVPIQLGFVYNAIAATISGDGIQPLFNMSSRVPGSNGSTTPYGSTALYHFNGLLNNTSSPPSQGESPVLPYPGGSQTNAAQNVTAVAGLTYTERQFSATANLVAFTVSYRWAFANQLGSTGAGARVRTQQQDSSLDGVQTSSTSSFDPNTGLVTLTSQANVNELGQNQLFQQAFTYFWQIYDLTRTLNILTPVIQVTKTTINSGTGTATTTGILVQTFKTNWGFGAGQWAADRAYVALSGSATFNSWFTSNNPPDPTQWVERSQVLVRTAHGLPLDAMDVLARHAITTYDLSGQYPIVTAFNSPSGADTLSWYGCEPYEAFGPWTSSAPGVSIADYITIADFHTGTQSLAVPAMPTSPQGPLAILLPADQTRQYVFSCWVRAANGFNPANGVAQATISFFNPANGQPVPSVPPIVVTLTPALVTQWNFFPVLINLPQLVSQSGLSALGIIIALTNANQTTVCYVDELRFVAVACRCQSVVYDPTTYLPTALIDTNGQAAQTRYDSFLIPFLQLGPLNAVDKVIDVAFSQSLTTAGGFVPALPNRALTLGSTLASRYYDFHDGALTDWTLTDAANWQIANGELTYRGTGTGPIGATAQIKLYQPANFAARVELASSGAGVSVALGDGIYFMRWNAGTQQWELIQVNSDNTVTVRAASKVTSAITGSWEFAVVDGFVVAYINAVELFSYQYTPPATIQPGYGMATLAATGQASFDDLVLLDSPQISMNFSDGLGGNMQQIGLIGYTPQNGGPFAQNSICLDSGQFYDPLGRVSVAREGLTDKLTFQSQNNGGSQPAQLLNGAPDSYLTDPSGNTLTYSQYLAGQGGSRTYSNITYETAPTSRRLTVVAPCPQNANLADFTTTLSYYGSANVTPPPPGQGGTTGLIYPVTATTAPFTKSAQNVTVLVDNIRSSDQLGRTLMRLQGPRGGTYLCTAFLYDDFGRMIQVHQPNYFAPPNGSIAATWVISMTYTYLGLLASRTTPDSGQTQFLYDSANRLRFTMDANGAALVPQRINYVKYDNLDRAVETGYIQDPNPNYAWGQLPGQVNNQQFPTVTGPNAVQGMWLKRMTYDVNASGNVQYLLGRLYQASINQNSATGPDTETYAYDAYGNVITKTVNMAALGSGSFTTNFAYNNQNQPQQITYPALDSNNPEIAFSYDRLGRLAAVGNPNPNDGVIDPSNPPPAPSQRYAFYQYDLNGRLLTATMNTAPLVPQFTRTYSYNANGWLTGIADPYFTEQLGYMGADALNYLNGTIANYAVQYNPSASWPTAPSPINSSFAYDNYARLITEKAQTPNGIPLDGWSGSLAAYDANGNIGTLTQGQTSTAYSYASSGAPAVQVSNQVTTLAANVQNSINFDNVAPNQQSANGWWWGSNNGGPSGSGVTPAQHPPNLAQSLEVTGGSLGHYEVFRLNTFLPANATLTLSWQVLTGAGYGQVIGSAAWFAVLYTAGGETVSVPIAAIPATNVWQTQTAQIPLAAWAATYGGGNVVQVGLELRNQCRTANGSTGPSIFIAAPSLTGSISAPSYQYDHDGNVTQAMARSLYALNYDAVTGRTSSIQIGSSTGNLLKASYGLDDNRTLKTYQTSGGSPTVLSQTLTLTGLDGQALAERVTAGANTNVQYFIPGIGGLAAIIANGASKILLRDHLGSLRVVVDSATGTVENSFDYLSFGGLIRASSQPEVSRLFTGQDLDQETGLYDYHARLYDTSLGRFYAVDAGGSCTSPYAYVSNNPVNLVDPSGEVAAPAALFGMAAQAAYKLWNYEWSYSTKEWIVSLRGNPDLSPIPRNDISLLEFLAVAPSWVYLSWKKIIPASPTEVWVLLSNYGFDSNRVRKQIASINEEARAFHNELSQSDVPRKNSLRHAYWMALMTRNFTAEFAAAVGDAHEYAQVDLTIEGPYDHVTDKINNAVGVAIAKANPTGNLSALVDVAWARNQLAWARDFTQNAHHVQSATVHWQLPLDELASKYDVVPEFNSWERATLSRHNVTLPFMRTLRGYMNFRPTKSTITWDEQGYKKKPEL